MRHEFSVCSQFKHHLRNNVSEAPGTRRIAKSHYVGVLPADIETPYVAFPQYVLAPCLECLQEFTADIFPAFGHHLGENAGPPCVRDILPARITISGKAKRRII